jgi:hypothetical protein
LHIDLKKNKEALKMANAEVEIRTCCQDRLVEKIALMDAALLLACYQCNFAQHLALHHTNSANALHHLNYYCPLPNHRFIQLLLSAVPDPNIGEDIEEIILSSYIDHNISMSDGSSEEDNDISDN